MFHLRFYSYMTLFVLFCVIAQAETPIDTQVNRNAEELNGNIDKNKSDMKQLNFEDELIEGSTLKPDLFYMFQKNNLKFKKLIKLRENFLPEMARGSEDLQRLRGGR